MNLTETKVSILEIFNKLLQLDYNEEQLSKALEEDQFTSIDYVRFIVAIEDAFQIEFEEDKLGVHIFLSLDDIAEYIHSMIEK